MIRLSANARGDTMEAGVPEGEDRSVRRDHIASAEPQPVHTATGAGSS